MKYPYISKPWLVSKKAHGDELLSSWLIRNAIVNGCNPKGITNYIWGSWQAWSTDLDRRVDNERLQHLANILSTNLSSFKKLTLEDIAKKIQGKSLPKHGVWAWVLSTGARNLNRSGGLQYCPECFKVPDPYFKKNSRLAWHTHCSIHQIRLLDSCYNCNLPLEPHRLKALEHTIINCPHCKASLAKAPQTEVIPNALYFQQACDDVLKAENYNYHSNSLSVKEFFELCTFFTFFIKRIAHKKQSALLQFANTIDLQISEITTHNPIIENATTNQRISIFNAVRHLMTIAPNELTSCLILAEVSQQAFVPKGAYLPTCLSYIHKQLKETSYKQQEARTKVIGMPSPRPRHEVQKRALQVIRALNT